MTKYEPRICNVCGMPEPTKDKPQEYECGGHWGLHPSEWNLAENNTKWGINSPIPLYNVTYRMYQKFFEKQLKRTTLVSEK